MFALSLVKCIQYPLFITVLYLINFYRGLSIIYRLLLFCESLLNLALHTIRPDNHQLCKRSAWICLKHSLFDCVQMHLALSHRSTTMFFPPKNKFVCVKYSERIKAIRNSTLFQFKLSKYSLYVFVDFISFV